MTTDAIDTAPRHGGEQPMGLAAAGMCLLTAALWGGTPVAISYSVDQLPPVAVAAVRFAMAAVFLFGWCRWEGSRLRLEAGQLRLVLGGGCLLFVQITLFNLGVAWSNSSHGSVLINTFVLWVVVIEHFTSTAGRLTWTRLGGVLAAAAGGLLVVATADRPSTTATGRDQATLAGDLVLLASAAVLGVKILFTKHALRTIEPGKFMFWHDLAGVALFVAWSAAFENVGRVADLRWPTVLSLLYQGLVVAGFCFAVQAVLLRRHAASQVSVFGTATPLFGVLFAALFRGDRLSPWLLISGGSVAAGIYFVSRAPRRPVSYTG